MSQRLVVEPGEYACVQLEADEPFPHWLPDAPFWQATRAADELSIICNAEVVPFDVSHEGGWAMLRLEGPFPFDLTGILSSVLTPLADAGVGILALSTFNTDYVLVKQTRLDDAVRALTRAGHAVDRS